VTNFAILPIDRIRLRGRAEALEIYALVGDEKVMETPSFRELRSIHLQLRAATMARDEASVRNLIHELKERAPIGLQPLYDVFAVRATDKSGTPEGGP
jgi:adenylate cyclase